jgi:predicted esterase
VGSVNESGNQEKLICFRFILLLHAISLGGFSQGASTSCVVTAASRILAFACLLASGTANLRAELQKPVPA